MKKKKLTREIIIRTALVELPALLEGRKAAELKDMRQQLEALSMRAGMIAAYIDEREGYGCGDQGHVKALKVMNRTGKIIYCKAFGYNIFHEINF